MDGAAAGWYFSTMPRRRRSDGAERPPLVEFHRTKYGRELLLDAAYVRQMPTFLANPGPHVLAFHDILLVTSGTGVFTLDGEACPVAPGRMLFSRPGEVREWRVRGLDGACLFFSEELVRDAFSDPRFLDRFSCLAADRPSAQLALPPARRCVFLERFDVMQREIAALRDDVSHALRAVLYEILVLLDRWYTEAHGRPAPLAPANAVVERYISLVERDFARRHRVAEYARELGVSPGHLGTLCRAHLRRSAGEVVRARLALEARRRLLYLDATAAQVADGLGFEDPAYFARFFRREVGESPTGFRARRRSAPGQEESPPRAGRPEG
jgi:AraC family transcriptional activator of pobA